jgi:glycosyltransferase involved in cell wall biosynthesis
MVEVKAGSMSGLSICIPTFKKNEKQIKDIRRTSNAEVVVSDQEGSAAFNRNYCLEKAKGDIIIMVDDDITGFFPGWDEVLIKPLEDPSVSIVSARLNTPMMYDGTEFNIVPSACIAFRKTGIRFDENFVGGFEDTDFCKQMEQAHPSKHTVINEECKLIHLNEKKRQHMTEARKVFVKKWGLVHHPKKIDRTIVYYTGNTEEESFEQKVRDNILRVKGNMPIISVSQKPIDFGKNICVGEIGKNYENAFKQVLIGLQEATTPYVVMCESDVLYPAKGYFDFVPTDPTVIYTYDNVWLMWDRINRTRFYKHGTTCGSIILSRELYISMLKDGNPNFFTPDIKWEHFTGEPMINIKTRNGVSWGTTIEKGVRPVNSFPYWGTPADVKRNYL